MPIFELQDAGGKTYEIDAPDMMTAAKAFQGYTPQTGIGDATSSFDAGMAEGVSILGGALGDVTNLGARGIAAATNFVERQLGLPESAPYDPSKSLLRHIPTSESMKSAIQRDFYNGEKPYQPQTKPGEILHAVGSFVPSTLAGGSGLLAKATTAVGGGLGHVYGGDAAASLFGEDARQYGQLAGGVAGGITAASGLNKATALRAEKAAQAQVPTAEKILETAGDQFKAVRNSGATIDGGDLAIVADGIKNQLRKEGFHPDAQGPVFTALDRLEKLGASGVGVPMSELEVIRKNLVNSKMSPDGSTRDAARQAIKEFMDYQTQLLPADVSKTLKDAIGNWAAGKRSNTVMGKNELGELNAATAGAGANVDNASRQAIKQLLRPVNNDIVPKASRMGFNEAEIAAMNEVARGTGIGNTSRLIGKAAPTGSVSAATAAYTGNAVGGPIGAIGLPAVGYVAKKIGDLSTKQGVAALDSLVRSRSPLAVEVAAKLPQLTKQLPQKSAALLTALVEQQQLAAPRNQINGFRDNRRGEQSPEQRDYARR